MSFWVTKQIREEAAIPQWLRQVHRTVNVKYMFLNTLLLLSFQVQRDDVNTDVLHEWLAVLHKQPAGVCIHSSTVG